MLSTGREQEAVDQDSGFGCLFLLILWPGTILSTLFNSKVRLAILSYLAQNDLKMKLKFGNLLLAFGIGEIEQL